MQQTFVKLGAVGKFLDSSKEGRECLFRRKTGIEIDWRARFGIIFVSLMEK